MIIDIKYHIASLVSVFLALGIGIVVGTTMIGSDVLMKKQEDLITSLQGQYASIRDENRQLTHDLDVMKEDANYQQEFNRVVLPALVRDKLRGRQVAIVDLNYRKEHDGLADALQEAGAKVQSVTVVNLNILQQTAISQEVAPLFGKNQGDSSAEYLPDFARFLANTMVRGMGDDVIHVLDGKGVLKISGAYGLPIQDVILIGGSSSKELDFARNYDLVLIKSLQNQGLRVFGAEDNKIPVSYMRYYQSAGLTTVDNIDDIYGQVALIQAMTGYPGRYGTKQTARDFLPPL